MIAVISGATGLVGSFLLPKLLADKSISKVVSIGRRTTGLRHERLEEIVVADITDLSGVEERLRGDLYFCCLGTTIKVAGSRENFFRIDHDAVIEFGRVAKKNGAKSLCVVTASGANASSTIFYNRVKGQTERDLGALKLNRLVIFHPALLLGRKGGQRAAEEKFTKLALGLQPWLPEFLSKRLMTSAEHLAARMLAITLQDGSGVQIVEAAQI